MLNLHFCCFFRWVSYWKKEQLQVFDRLFDEVTWEVQQKLDPWAKQIWRRGRGWVVESSIFLGNFPVGQKSISVWKVANIKFSLSLSRPASSIIAHHCPFFRPTDPVYRACSWLRAANQTLHHGNGKSSNYRWISYWNLETSIYGGFPSW